MSDIPRHVIVDERNDLHENLNLIRADSFANEEDSIGSLIDEDVILQEIQSIPSIGKERNNNDDDMSVSTTEDEFEDDSTFAISKAHADDQDMADYYDMDSSSHPSLNSEAEDLSYNVTDTTCPLCFCSVDGGEAIVLPNCKHSVCFSCVQQHIQASRKRSLSICCPINASVECYHPLHPSLVRQINAMAIPDSLALPTLRRSVYHPCPTLGCTNLVYWKEGNGPPIGDCFQCNKTCCLKCGVIPYHSHKTCQEYQASRKQPSAANHKLHVIEERGDRNTRRCSL